jgi:dihydroflavonol-4-reductase
MKVLVTGSTGFLGSHTVRALLGAGHTVRALVRPGRPRAALDGLDVELAEGDVLDEASLRAACRGADGLIHCAARTGYWSRQNAVQRAVNVEGTAKLLRAAHAAEVRKIVHVSSIATIGCTRNDAPRALDETHAWNPRSMRIHYVTTKKESEERALAAAWAGMDVVVVNPCMLVGPRFDGKRASATVLRIARGETKWIPPGGTSVADVEDVARGCALALERGRKGERYILGGHNVTWAELYGAIAGRLGVRAPGRRMPIAAVRALRFATGALDLAHLSRPPWTPEIFRALGWCAFVDSKKAGRELGYEVRPFEDVIARACVGVND